MDAKQRAELAALVDRIEEIVEDVDLISDAEGDSSAGKFLRQASDSLEAGIAGIEDAIAASKE